MKWLIYVKISFIKLIKYRNKGKAIIEEERGVVWETGSELIRIKNEWVIAISIARFLPFMLARNSIIWYIY